MQIEGVFSGEEIDDYPVCLNTYGQMGLKYAKYPDENVHLNLKEIPVFERVLDYTSKNLALFSKTIKFWTSACLCFINLTSRNYIVISCNMGINSANEGKNI